MTNNFRKAQIVYGKLLEMGPRMFGGTRLNCATWEANAAAWQAYDKWDGSLPLPSEIEDLTGTMEGRLGEPA